MGDGSETVPGLSQDVVCSESPIHIDLGIA